MASLDLSLEDYFDDVTEDAKQAQLSAEGYSDLKALKILDEFLQPNSTISLMAATDSIIGLLPPWDNSPSLSPSVGFAFVVYEVARHIPWNHPSMLKLVSLVECLGWSNRFSDLDALKSPSDVWHRNRPFAMISRDCWDGAQRADPSDPKELQGWVSFCAFEALFDALNITNGEPCYIRMTFECTFDKPEYESQYSWHANAPGVERAYRDAFIMGAAQWIIWNGQAIYRRAMYKGPWSGPKTLNPGEEDFYSPMTFVTMEKLRRWKRGFKDAIEEKGISEEAKDVALRAHRIMDVLETNMVVY